MGLRRRLKNWDVWITIDVATFAISISTAASVAQPTDRSSSFEAGRCRYFKYYAAAHNDSSIASWAKRLHNLITFHISLQQKSKASFKSCELSSESGH